MKKTISLFLFALCCLTSFAQLKVYTNGNVGIKSSLDSTSCRLSIGNRTYGSGYDVYLSSSNPLGNQYNIGIDGRAYNDTVKNGYSMGVRGIAGNGTTGYNYGVMGILKGDGEGAGVYGGIMFDTGVEIKGQYAGFFSGDIKVTGGSKIRLVNEYDNHQSATPVSNSLNILSGLSPGYIQTLFSPPLGNSPEMTETVLSQDETNDTERSLSDEEGIPRPTNRHYFLSWNQGPPYLVYTDMEQREYINYTELIPLLVGAINELSTRLNLLEQQSQQSNTYSMEEESTTRISTMSINTGLEECRLYQNTPNPFSGRTVIRFELPEEVSDAYIFIFNMQGTMLSQIPVRGTTDRITINGYDYGPGMYIYSLIVNGKEMDSKRMILTK